MLELVHASASDPGLARDNNEDCLGAIVPTDEKQNRAQGFLFVLADGVGGQSRGEVASSWAVASLTEGFRHAPAGAGHSDLLTRLIQHANTRIFENNLSARDRGMATTVVACALRQDRATIAHVGDSRCYLLRDGTLRPLTKDHSLAAEQVRLGLVGAAESDGAPRHILTRALGPELLVRPDIHSFQLRVGDRLLLCSDGLHGALPDADIQRLLNRGLPLPEIIASLIELANRRDGSDNVTLHLLSVTRVEATALYRGRPYRLRG